MVRRGAMAFRKRALRKARNARELSMLLQLAGLPTHLVPALLADGVSVRMMAASTLERIEHRLAQCAGLHVAERCLLLEAVHVHVHRLPSLIDEDVRRMLSGTQTETLPAALALAERGTASEGAVCVARAVRGC